MKKKIALALSALMLTGTLLGGCGLDEKITVNKDLSSKIDVGMYLTEEEYQAYKDFIATEDFKKVDKDGKNYYLAEESSTLTQKEFEKQIGRLDDNCLVIYTNGVTDGATAGGQVTDEDIQQVYDSIEFSDMTITLPFTVAETNAKKGEEGNIITLDKEQSLSSAMVYAVSDPALLKGTDLKISGASNKAAYNKKKTVTITTADGVIESMSVKVSGFEQAFSDADHPYNVTVCSSEGKYTVSAKLVSGTTKTIQFTIDKTKPTSNIKDGKTYKSGKKITFSDKMSGIKSAKLDGKTVKSGKVIKKKGTHKLVLTDKAGNKTTIKFKIK